VRQVTIYPNAPAGKIIGKAANGGTARRRVRGERHRLEAETPTNLSRTCPKTNDDPRVERHTRIVGETTI